MFIYTNEAFLDAAIGPLRGVTPYLTGCERVSVGEDKHTKQQYGRFP